MEQFELRDTGQHEEEICEIDTLLGEPKNTGNKQWVCKISTIVFIDYKHTSRSRA